MPKGIRLEKVSGVVALSYLVLIPATAYVAWRKIQTLDKDLTVVWDKLDMPEDDRAVDPAAERFRRYQQGRAL